MPNQILKLPILSLSRHVLFPGSTRTLRFVPGRGLSLLQDCYDNDRPLALLHPNSEGDEERFARVGVAASVLQLRELKGGNCAVTLAATERVNLVALTSESAQELGEFAKLQSTEKLNSEQLAGLVEEVTEAISVNRFFAIESAELLEACRNDAEAFVDCACQVLPIPLADKFALLEEEHLSARAERLLRCVHALTEELEESMPQSGAPELNASVRTLPDGGDSTEDNLSVSFRQRAQMLGELPLPVREQVFLETERLRLISTASAEYASIKAYLDWLLAIPWARADAPRHDLAEMQEIVERSFYGPRTVKDNIVEYLATRQIAAEVPTPPLCFSGPSGTGKAALAHAIAEALGRQRIRFSLAGVLDSIDVRGEPRSLVGAMPGKLVTSLIEAGTNNPVIFIEDLDKLCQDESRLSAALALLAAIDSKQNHKFMDDYVGLPLDLSKAIFIFSVRNTEDIPEALRERMEIIEFPGYIDKEKLLISEKYLIPALLRRFAIEPEELTFSGDAIRRLISNYTMEAGLGQLKGRLEAICRRFAKCKASGERNLCWTVNVDNVEDFLGTPVYLPEKAATHPEIGVAAGVAWTGAGGDIMMIEGLKMKGVGLVTCTGSLGEVMRESVQAAHSFVRSKADLLSIDHEDFATYDIHIHFPQGAIPKDGPSAGVTISLVIASVMSDRPIRNDIAMTGEVSLRGRVLPVAGVKEKVAAAHRAGIFKFVLPRLNQKDLKDIPEDLKREMEFLFIDRTDQLFEIALLEYEPGAETLEDLLILELKEQAARDKEKNERAAKSRTRSRSSSKSTSKRKPRKKTR